MPLTVAILANSVSSCSFFGVFGTTVDTLLLCLSQTCAIRWGMKMVFFLFFFCMCVGRRFGVVPR